MTEPNTTTEQQSQLKLLIARGKEQATFERMDGVSRRGGLIPPVCANESSHVMVIGQNSPGAARFSYRLKIIGEPMRGSDKGSTTMLRTLPHGAVFAKVVAAAQNHSHS